MEGHTSKPGRRSRALGWLVSGLVALGGRAWTVLVYSSVYLGVITMAQVAIAMTLLDLPPSPAPVVGGLVTFAIYANDRIADADTDAVSNPRQARFVRAHGDRLYQVAAVAYGVAVALSVLGGPIAFAITIFPAVVWILYGTELVAEFGVPVGRLKEVFLVNSLVVASAWALSVTLLPMAYAGASLSPTALVVFAYFLLGTFVATEIPNVRDVRGDRRIGVSTLPVVLGVTRTRQVLYLVEGLVALLVVVGVYAGDLGGPLGVALLIGVAYSLGVIALLGRVEGYDLLTIAAEFEYVIVSIALAPVVYGL